MRFNLLKSHLPHLDFSIDCGQQHHNLKKKLRLTDFVYVRYKKYNILLIYRHNVSMYQIPPQLIKVFQLG